MAMPWAARLAPEPFRDFLPYASASALKVIHVTQVARRALEVAQHVSDQTSRMRAAARLEESLRAAGFDSEIRILSEPGPGLTMAGLSEGDRTTIGDRVLALYFHLLHWDGPLFLDLRPRHFRWVAERRQLWFYPSGLWCNPDADFTEHLRALYAGFYRQDRLALARGIELYRWDCSPSDGFDLRIEQLLRSHFGSAGDLPTRFSIAHFRTTFDAIFDEVAASHAKLHPDLTFLGVELVSLYLTLESVAVALDAQRAFERAVGL